MPESSAGGWPCFVGSYEIWPVSRLPPKDRKYEHDLEAPHLVLVGPTERKIPKREVWDMAVLRLLKTKLPKSMLHSSKQLLEIQAESMRLGISQDSDAYAELWEKKHKEMAARPSDYTDIAKSALEISSHLGMLAHRGKPEDGLEGRVHHERLFWWAHHADQIQAMFYGREARRGLPKDLMSRAGSLEIVLFYGPEGVSMRLLPDRTGAALLYHAAQMVTNGTKLLNFEYCNSPILSGGEARGGGKRRRDARFCSDECRWKHHNEVRRKSKRKTKL